MGKKQQQQQPVPVQMPKPLPPTFKIVAVNVGEEFTPEDGWTVKDLISTPIGKDNEPSNMIFHVVLMKLPELPKPEAPAEK